MKKHLSRLLAAFLALTLLAAPASALTVDQALELLEDTYYYGIPDEARQADSLEELFQFLDPYTEYMSETQYASFLNVVESTVDVVGVGVIIQYTDEGILVDSVVSGGGAQGAGLQAGDLIVAIDGVSCVPANTSHQALILGTEDTQVVITVLRDGAYRDYTITRRAVYIPNTRVTLLDGGVGYVNCDSFGADSGKLFYECLQQYDSQVDCWLVDLRSNPGGYVDSALQMIAAVNGPGRYLYFEEQGGRVTGYSCYTTAATQKPLIVLVNGESASASELLSAGIRDTQRGITVGSRTYGKGVAQAILDEDTDPEYFDGDCLKVTTARFYTAGGSTTDRIGVIPTLLVDDSYARAVAEALCRGSEETSTLCVMPGSIPFYVDPDADGSVLAALLEALPPQAKVFCSDGVYNELTPDQAAAWLGLAYDSRWFDDVADSPYADAINAMAVYRLLNGTAPGQFSPTEQLTRAQLCVMLARVLNVTFHGPSRFTDVAADAWYAGEVNAMAELGLVNGVGGGRFNPDGTLTHEEFLTIMGRLARYLNFALDAYGQEVEDNLDHLPLWMQLSLVSYTDWAKSDMAVLLFGLEDVLGGRGTLLYTNYGDLDTHTPPPPSAPTLREEAAAGMYAVLAGLDILP